MTNSMGPPPPKNPNLPPQSRTSPPPPPPNPQPSNPDSDSNSSQSTTDSAQPEPPPPPPLPLPSDSIDTQTPKPSQGVAVPYKIPPWSAAPCHEFHLEVLKDGSIIDKLNVFEKGAYMFGRLDLCDFVLEHPTISMFHAVIKKPRGVG